MALGMTKTALRVGLLWGLTMGCGSNGSPADVANLDTRTAVETLDETQTMADASDSGLEGRGELLSTCDAECLDLIDVGDELLDIAPDLPRGPQEMVRPPFHSP